MTLLATAPPAGSAQAAFERLAADPGAIAWPGRPGSWLGRLAVRAPGLPVPAWLLRPDERRRRRVCRLVRSTELFAPGWYRAQYGALAALDGDPLRHFIKEGAARGFLPSAAWQGLAAEECVALAERHGKAGRSLWRFMRAQRGPGSDVFARCCLMPLGPFTPAAFAGAVDAQRPAGAALAPDLLVIDHAMGGGANRYRDQRLGEAMAQNRTVALLTYHIADRRYVLELGVGRARVFAAAVDLAEVATLLRPLAPRAVLLNNLASYPDVAGTITLLRELYDDRVTVELPLHDFQAVCPSFNLLDEHRTFCGIPPVERCRTCIAGLELPVATQAAPRDIDAWRAAWSGLLAQARPIVAFSRSSRDLLLRAHPALDVERITVRPHRVDWLSGGPLSIERTGPLHIGVVGEISVAKGAAVVAGLARALARRPGGTRLTVIGTVDRAFAAGIDQTGRYRTADLPDLVARAGINLGLVPSIWPETFCYVAEELIALGLPVAAFDLGAPAERLRRYPLGHVLRAEAPDEILDELETFWQSLREGGAASSSVAATSARVGS